MNAEGWTMSIADLMLSAVGPMLGGVTLGIALVIHEAVKRKAYRAGRKDADDDARLGDRQRRGRLDGLVAEYRAQRDAAQAALVAAHVERDRLKAENDRLRKAARSCTVDLNQVWHAARTVMCRVNAMEGQLAAFAGRGDGDGPGDPGDGRADGPEGIDWYPAGDEERRP